MNARRSANATRPPSRAQAPPPRAPFASGAGRLDSPSSLFPAPPEPCPFAVVSPCLASCLPRAPLGACVPASNASRSLRHGLLDVVEPDHDPLHAPQRSRLLPVASRARRPWPLQPPEALLPLLHAKTDAGPTSSCCCSAIDLLLLLRHRPPVAAPPSTSCCCRTLPIVHCGRSVSSLSRSKGRQLHETPSTTTVLQEFGFDKFDDAIVQLRYRDRQDRLNETAKYLYERMRQGRLGNCQVHHRQDHTDARKSAERNASTTTTIGMYPNSASERRVSSSDACTTIRAKRPVHHYRLQRTV